MINILQIILIIAVFIPVRYLVYRWTNQENYPQWLDYKPFNCELCCTFWTLLTIYLAIGLTFGINITLIGGITLTILNAIAMYINQRRKTIKI